MRVVLRAIVITIAFPASVHAQATVTRWLTLGPVPAPTPFAAAMGDSARLDASSLKTDGAWPASGDKVPWSDGRTLTWQEGGAGGGASDVVYSAAYLESDRWTRASLTTDGTGPAYRVWLDGVRVKGGQVTLARGKHFLLVQRLGGSTSPLAATVKPTTSGAVVVPTLDPGRPATWRDLHVQTQVGDITLDPAATRVAMLVRRQDMELDRTLQWLEVRDAGTGRLLTEVRGGSSPSWSRDGSRLAYVTQDGGAELWTWNVGDGTTQRVLKGEPLSSVVDWSPDGEWIYYTGRVSIGGEPAAKPGEARRLTEVWQRNPGVNEKTHLFAASTSRRLKVTLVGDSAVGVSGVALSPDGKTFAFTRTVPTHLVRPWMIAELWTMDAATLKGQKVMDLTKQSFTAPGSLAWAPDGKAVAFCASAKETLKDDDPSFSVYETELYATNIERPRLVHLSNGYVPSVGGGLGCSKLIWNAKDGRIYVPVEAGASALIARTQKPVSSAVESTSLETITLPNPVMAAFDLKGTTLVLSDEGPTTPAAVHRVDLATGKASDLVAPNARLLDGIVSPTWKPWSFRNSRGEDIEAWYWLPTGFDATKKYPTIVHYYGGTLAMKKNYETRLNYFASQGYVVLFMNPAGAPGYGQKFSNYHVNDWGYPAATDIIEGTEQFSKTHAFVDADRIGNFGHSYGGFMTMHLHTRTKIFRTGISLAGISNIADYWGAGGSGFSYTDGTCPGCYPWNRKDLYVDRSPLFQADKITAPMLLIHGTLDDNVVPTESEQMFTALRMLGRETELIRVTGENHGIGSKPSVAEMRDGMLLDWFDKYLKGQPAAWSARWEKSGASPVTTPIP
ncbi:MAG: S9 family peptidase [Cytophagaceae bacterium]|nr:S9 family peptidase [Gemmatimonadaceae bacterium]